MFDYLNHLDPRPLSEEGVWFPLRHLRGGASVEVDGKTLELKLAGPDSDRHRQYIQEYSRRLARLRQTSPGGEPDPKETERALQECAAMVVLDWRGFKEPFSRENVEALFRKLYWAALQTDANAGGRAGFLPVSVNASSTSSVSASDET